MKISTLCFTYSESSMHSLNVINYLRVFSHAAKSDKLVLITWNSFALWVFFVFFGEKKKIYTLFFS